MKGFVLGAGTAVALAFGTWIGLNQFSVSSLDRHDDRSIQSEGFSTTD